MPFQFGNSFWKIANVGMVRTFSSPEELWQKACEYFQWVDDNPYKYADFVGKDGIEIEREKPIPYTQDGLCIHLGISEETFRNYSKKEGYDAFFEVCTRISSIIRTQKFTGASIGIFNANIIARDLGLVDKAESKTDGKQEIIVKYERKRSDPE